MRVSRRCDSAASAKQAFCEQIRVYLREIVFVLLMVMFTQMQFHVNSSLISPDAFHVSRVLRYSPRITHRNLRH